MISLVTCLLLLMNVLCLTRAGLSLDDPPLLSIKELSMGDAELKALKEERLMDENGEASRVVVAELRADAKYLMRFDPPEHCTRIIICSVEEDGQKKDPITPCHDQKKFVLIDPLSNGEDEIDGKIRTWVYTVDTASTSSTKEDVKGDAEEQIMISYEKSSGASGASDNLNLLFNPQSNDDPVQLEAKMRNDKGKAPDGAEHDVYLMRVETSSFYCNVHIGISGSKTSKDDLAPRMRTFKNDKPYTGAKLHRFLLGKAFEVKHREFFGPLFRDPKGRTKLSTSKQTLVKTTKDDKSECNYVHDLMGFGNWPMNKNNSNYINTFYGNVHHYSLKQLSTLARGGSTTATCGTQFTEPFQLDIEINNVFKFNSGLQKTRCFGFALVFGTKDATTTADTTTLDFDPKHTFEFYTVSSMFLAPDSEKVRAIRTKRADLRKIRISFFTAKKTEEKPFAIVEYGFLNDKIAGVREYVVLPNGWTEYKTVSLLSQGFCQVRVLSVNNEETAVKPEGSRCMALSGCKVLKVNENQD